MQQVLCDTSVFLALWPPDEKSTQEVFSKQFFEDAKKYAYSINVLEITTGEINKKYSFLLEDYFSLCRELFELKKFRELKVGDCAEILKLFKESKSDGFKLSFNGCALVFAAEKKKMLLLSWDKHLIEFAKSRKASAEAPSEL